MSDSPPPYISPPSYSPPTPPPYGPPPWTLINAIISWVQSHTGVTFAGAPNVAVPVDDLQPRAKHAQLTLDAVDDIRFCETFFDNWMTEWDNVMSDKEPDERDERLRFYLGRLKDDAVLCSNATNPILQYHVQFASLMAQRIDDASKSQYNLKYDNPLAETTKLAEDICNASNLLSKNVNRMTDELKSFVAILEETQVAVKNERLLAEQTLGWLKSLFNAITSIPATVCLPISALLPSTDCKRQKSAFLVSTLREAASIFCTADPEPQEGKESESLDSVILFLKEIVPREAQNAQKKLQRFDEAFDITGPESHMRADGRVTLDGPDLAAVAKEWRDVAEQYQSAIAQKKS